MEKHEKLLQDIKKCDRMSQLDELRIKCVSNEYNTTVEDFQETQKTFIKQKNKIQRKGYEFIHS